MNETIEKRQYHFKGFTTECEVCNVEGAAYTVLYIHGLRSNPWSRKAEVIKSCAAALKISFCRYELIGHGSDEADFPLCDFELWKEQLEEIITREINTPVIIAGHCVGGWLGMCLAEKFPARVKAFLSLATCPDLIEQKLSTSTPEQRKKLAETGMVETTIERFHYVLSQRLWTSMHQNDLLQKPEIGINCPIHLLQGKKDNFIDWTVVLRLLEKVRYPKTVVKILKDSSHHLQDPVALQAIQQSFFAHWELVKKNERKA